MPRLLELCAGTGSVGKPFKKLGWEVISLDFMPNFSPTIQADLMTWDYKAAFPPGHFDVVWCSPPCTEYSVALTTRKRDLDKADALVSKMLVIMEYFQPKVWAFENPYTGLLKTRPIVKGLPYKTVCYCKYGFLYRKATAIWCSKSLENWHPRPMCTKSTPCESIVDGRHLKTAQRGPCKKGEKRFANDSFTQHQLYSMPSALCEEFAHACVRSMEQPTIGD